MEYLTRLTPNFFCWEKPSGRDGKCKGHLFEDGNGFGWEEWLLKDYHANKKKPEHVCKGFIQAPGCYYLGYIENIQIGNYGKYNASEIKTDLRNVGLKLKSPIEVRNVEFKVKDVHFICLDKNLKPNLNPSVGQFRFALYDLDTHHNLQSKINTIKKNTTYEKVTIHSGNAHGK